MRLRAELIPTIPAPARVVARNVLWTYGRATSGVRPLPDFLIIGAQKAGTTALYAYLREHPAIAGPPWKEVSFFDRHYRRGNGHGARVKHTSAAAYLAPYASEYAGIPVARLLRRLDAFFAPLDALPPGSPPPPPTSPWPHCD